MIDSEIFLKEANKLKNIDKKDLENLLDIVIGKDTNINPSFLADKIINDLFSLYNVEALVPWRFLETEIGKALILAKFELGNDIYFVSDLVEFTGYSKQYISKEVKQNNIQYKKKGGIIYFTEKSLNEYLRKKGIETISKRKEIQYKETRQNIKDKEL